MTPNLPNKKVPKYKTGDYLLLQLGVQIQYPSIWVGQITDIRGSWYSIKCLSSCIKGTLKLPFLFEPCIRLVEEKNLKSTIKAIKILYDR